MMSSCQLMEFARTRFGVEDTCMRHANRLIDKRCLILLLHWKIDDPPPPPTSLGKVAGRHLDVAWSPSDLNCENTNLSVSIQSDDGT